MLVDRERGPNASVLPGDLRFLTERHYGSIRQGHPGDVENLADKVSGKRSPSIGPRTAGVEATRPALDRFLRHILPPAQQWAGNLDRLIDLTLAVLGPNDRLEFIAPGRLRDGARGSATVLVTLTELVVVEVDKDFLICGEIWLPRSTIRRVEVVPTLPLFADALLRTTEGRSVRLLGLFRDQARELADRLRP